MPAVAETVVPEPEEAAQAAIVLRALREPTAHLVGADGRHVEIPHVLFEVLARVAQALVDGQAITIAPQHTELTTNEAAALLGISRPTLIKLLNEGAIPHTRPGSRRRIRLRDVLEYQQRRSTQRRDLLNDMTADSIDMGIYDLSLPEDDNT